MDGKATASYSLWATWWLSFACYWNIAGSHRRLGGRKMSATNTDYHNENDLISFLSGQRFKTILADPPWQFQNRTGKIAPEHKRLNRYPTMTLSEIKALPVGDIVDNTCHLYLWVPNALLPDGLEVMKAWGFEYKTNIVWEKVRKDGNPDGRGVGFYFRNVTEMVLFGIRGSNARTLAPARSQVNLLRSQKREHSRKPDEIFDIIEQCSSGPYLELFARGHRPGWVLWGNQAGTDYTPDWSTYKNADKSVIEFPIAVAK